MADRAESTGVSDYGEQPDASTEQGGGRPSSDDGVLPPSCLYAIALIQYGIDETLEVQYQTPDWYNAVENQLYEMDYWMPDEVMRYLTHSQEGNYPTDAVKLVQQAGTPLEAALKLIELVTQNLVASGVEIVFHRPWL